MSNGNSKAFKAAVRARMQMTGEKYTVAMRAMSAGDRKAKSPAASHREPLREHAHALWGEIEAEYGDLLAELPGPSYDRFEQSVIEWIDTTFVPSLVLNSACTLDAMRAVIAEFTADLLRREYLPETWSMFAAAAVHPYSAESFELEDLLIEIALGRVSDLHEALSHWETRNFGCLYPRS